MNPNRVIRYTLNEKNDESDIAVLLKLYQQYGSDAYGRIGDLPNSDKEALIERFIAGECSEEERLEFAGFLRLHPSWIRWIADRIKMAREHTDRSPEQHHLK